MCLVGIFHSGRHPIKHWISPCCLLLPVPVLVSVIGINLVMFYQPLSTAHHTTALASQFTCTRVGSLCSWFVQTSLIMIIRFLCDLMDLPLSPPTSFPPLPLPFAVGSPLSPL